MKKILVIDFGSQYTQLIARRLRELSVYSEVCPWDEIPVLDDVEGFILSGGPESSNIDGNPTIDSLIFNTNKPILGICYGMQVLAHQEEGVVINEGKDPNTIAMPTGGQHLMMIAGYDPVSKTVEVDNSWGQISDFATREQLLEAGIDPATRVTFSTADLYNSMQRKANTTSSKTFKQWFWMRDR